jgi:aspartate kinase
VFEKVIHKGRSLRIGGIIEEPNLCLVKVLGIPDKVGGAAAAVRSFGKVGVNIEFISESADVSGLANITVAIGMSDLDRFAEHMSVLQRETGAVRVEKRAGCAVVGVYGPHFREIPGVAAMLFSALSEADVNLLAIASSISSLCCVVADKDRAAARKAILVAFETTAE